MRAAEVSAAAGLSVTLFDAKPSVGRKFLVAGRGGLNLTHAESRERFTTRYGGGEAPDGRWASLLADFDADASRAWASGLGVETFVATTGRVYPREMKAAPLLRRWVRRLRESGVTFALRHRWTGLRQGANLELEFATDGEFRVHSARAVVLALGGGSWPETGSDGAWVSALEKLGVGVSPLLASNCGWDAAWSEAVLARAEGKPLKNIVARAGDAVAVGELLVTRNGLEGGAIYQLGPSLRAMPEPAIEIDFKPTHPVGDLVRKLGNCPRNFLTEARARWRLPESVCAILEFAHGPFDNAESLSRFTKACRIPLKGSRPIAEAISSAGGVRWSELDATLMLKRLPGVFVAGEMMDWDAPTGGYLMQGCFATGTRAAHGAVEWLRATPPR